MILPFRFLLIVKSFLIPYLRRQTVPVGGADSLNTKKMQVGYFKLTIIKIITDLDYYNGYLILI